MTTRFAPLRGITLAMLLTLGGGQGLMFGDEGRDKLTCTLATLKGRYLFGGIATLLPPAQPQPTSLAVAGFHIFNGDGTGTDVVTSTINGAILSKNFVGPISYTVNPDCTGTYTVPSEGLTFSIFIAPGGEELIVIGTKPGFVLVQGPNRRVSQKVEKRKAGGWRHRAPLEQPRDGRLGKAGGRQGTVWTSTAGRLECAL